jgi:hypothetical protein
MSRVQVSYFSNMGTVTILYIFIFKMLWVLIMLSDISGERAAFVFRVTVWFKWLLECLAREYLCITWEGCKFVACYKVCPFFPFRSSHRPKSLHLFYITDAVRGCAVAKVVRRRPFAAEVRFQSPPVRLRFLVDKVTMRPVFPVNICQCSISIYLSITLYNFSSWRRR